MEYGQQIKKITVKREKYVGKDCTVIIDLEKGAVDWAEETLFYQKPKTIKVLSPEERILFLEKLKETKLLEWAPKYYDLDKMDGEMWTVTVEDDTDLKKSTGNTVHPPEWEAFCALISEISGKELR